MHLKKFFWPLIVAVLGSSLGANLLGREGPSPVLLRYGSFSWNSNYPGGIASDGTNFLIAGNDANGKIVVSQMSKDWPVTTQTFDLGRTGGPPRVAFDGANYLVVWLDLAEPPADLYGQFVNVTGTKAGSPFLIESDVNASETGGLVFDGTNYLVVWEGHGTAEGAMSTVQGRLIGRSGVLLGQRLQISEGTTSQKYPAVACSSNCYFVAWTSQTGLSNSWNVVGRKISKGGVLLKTAAISEIPAQRPWPTTVTSDGTNWLVVWSRERGPYQLQSTNVWIPALFGRLMKRDATFTGHEIEVCWGRFGQFKPAALFDGKNYVVAWLDRRRGEPSGSDLYSTEFTSYVAQIDPAGMHVGPEWAVAPAGSNLFNLVLGQNVEKLFCAWTGEGLFSIRGTFLIHLTNETPVLHDFKLLPTGEAQLDLDCRAGTYVGIQTSSNLIDWSDLGFRDLQGSPPYCPGRITVIQSATGMGDKRFFRAYNGQGLCIENLRLIQQAKEHWALENDRANSDVPPFSELVGPGKFFPTFPYCPHFGTYTWGAVESAPACSLGASSGHTN